MSDYVRFAPGEKRPCWVRPDRERWPEHADRDWRGLVAAWRRKGRRWQAYVEFSTGMGENRGGWFDQEQVRRREYRQRRSWRHEDRPDERGHGRARGAGDSARRRQGAAGQGEVVR